MPSPLVQWQAHRGGGGLERPDNTMCSFLYGWSLGGIPEADVRRTRDGRIICLHDATLERTTDARAEIARVPVTELLYAEVAAVDAGARFSPEYAGEHVPLLEEVLRRTTEQSERRMYLDLKTVDLGELQLMIRRFRLGDRIYVASPDPRECEELRSRLPGARTMLWCGGTEGEIQRKLRAAAATGFRSLDQVQLHLNDDVSDDADRRRGWRYEIKPELMAEALVACSERGVDLEVFPWKFEEGDIRTLIELGVRWFATDEPSRFLGALRACGALEPPRSS